MYDLGDKVQRIIKSNIARAFVDLNRSQDDLPPTNPDGVIKSSTCYKKPIYHERKEPDDSLRTLLLELYYFPYHNSIQKSLKELELQLCLDCHSMASIAPGISPDAKNSKRPKFCLSNNDGQAASQEMMELLTACISESYGIERNEISLNDPFHGGHITKTYGNNPVPWIQVEMNRDLYLADPWFDKETLSIDPTHLEKLNKQFEKTLNLFFKNFEGADP